MKDHGTDMQDSGMHDTLVLLVEDNPDDREYICDMLTGDTSGIVVHAVETGTEAVSYVAANPVDCVLLDYRLGSESGIEVLTAIKEIAVFCPVIMLTGQGTEEIAVTVMKQGASDYLVKQRINQTNLTRIVQNAVVRGSLEARVAEQEIQRAQFLDTLVHDLRQPLQNISALGRMAAEDAADGDIDGMNDLLAQQAIIANRANDLIETLANYALLDGEVDFSDACLTDAATSAKENLALVISEKQAVVEIADLPTINGHMPQLVQLFQNLIGNGLKYNESKTPNLSIGGEVLEDGSCLIRVVDTGVGIPDAYLKAVFQPLKRLWRHDQFEGTGLGLSLCQKIVERHAGRIWCDSEINKGSKFNMVFPAK